MKIAYLLQMADVSGENGISKKILGQLQAWRAVGHDCRWFQLNPFAEVWSPLAQLPHQAPHRGGPLLRTFQSLALCREIAAWRPDLVYFRYAYHAPGLPSLFRRFPAIAEVNSDDLREYPVSLGAAKNLYHRLTRRRVLRSVAAFTPVTQELSRLVSPFARPALILGNSIDLADFAPLPSAPAGLPVRLVFIGSARTPWHGLERIGELARLFPEWSVHIIGDDASIWPALSTLPPPANLVFHGTLSRERYLPLLASTTAALGTFGLYRKSMQEACPLKVREYLALGLPVIGACADTDIPDGADYYLRLPNGPSSLAPHREEISAFVATWQGRRVPRLSIAHLDTTVKEALRLDFMTGVVANWRAARGLPPLAP